MTLDLSSGYQFRYLDSNLKKFVGNNYALDDKNRLVALAYHDDYNLYLTTDESLSSENVRLVWETYSEYTATNESGLAEYTSCKGATDALFEIKTDSGYEYVKFDAKGHFNKNKFYYSVMKVNDTESNKTSVTYFKSGIT